MDSRQQISNASMDTLSLLDLPLRSHLNILRYLDEESLSQAKLTCFSLYSVINANKTKLAATKIHSVTFRRLRNRILPPTLNDVGVFVEVVVRKTANCRSPKRRYFSQDVGRPLRELEDLREIYVNDSKISHKAPFCEWIAFWLVNVDIEILEMNQVHFCHDEVSYLEKALQGKKIRAKLVEIKNSMYNEPHTDLLLRCTKIFSPDELQIQEKNPELRNFMLKPSFLKFISTLQRFDSANLLCGSLSDGWTAAITEMPSNFYKFPPSFSMGAEFLLSMNILRKALQEWLHNRRFIEKWLLILPAKYANKDMFLSEIDIPYESMENGSYRIRNCVGKEIFMKSFLRVASNNSNFCRWNIGVKRYL